MIKNKVDFALVITAENCNPNGDPTCNNYPRQDCDGYGLISDVCLKRKIRDRLQESGENILMVNQGRCNDGFTSTKERVDAFFNNKDIMDKIKAGESLEELACKNWIDVRTFGQVLAIKAKLFDSVGIKGCVSIREAKSIEPIFVRTEHITKSTNNAPGPKKDSTTISERYYVDRGVYVSFGTVFPQLSKQTGFDYPDLKKIKSAILNIFENDASVSRPSGSMILKLFWWEHQKENYNSAKVHRLLKIESISEYPYYTYNVDSLPNLELTIYD